MKPTHYFVFDVESVGLHGEGFAVGGGVFADNGAIQYGFTFACDPARAQGTDEDRQWVNDNVPVIDSTHRSPRGIRDAFWEKWVEAKTRYSGIRMAADCGWPVEARFLCACIDDDKAKRNWEGPYPFLEISDALEIAGMDPMANYERTPSEMPKHHPYADAVQSARLLFEALNKLP
jgi:hypothetical protein